MACDEYFEGVLHPSAFFFCTMYHTIVCQVAKQNTQTTCRTILHAPQVVLWYKLLEVLYLSRGGWEELPQQLCYLPQHEGSPILRVQFVEQDGERLNEARAHLRVPRSNLMSMAVLKGTDI